ncbi:MAG: hypothetical protein KZY74_17460 [Paenibacillaceae bacterium]|uniref:Uncharacterized protein n=1 Tax=Paenibacillus mellifer TaxID=2937794 RepID=A0A9X1Y100_9BACL|nr:hypothetical protein [Paenibacillus mellifer]MBW4841182.1 hypothetical protein [Paenibacillaceae bacterium]MCK8488476.1 hypothetical protein [Paenibacillus mellifer]
MLITDSPRKKKVVLQARECLYVAERLGINRWLDPNHPFHVFLRETPDPEAEDAREALKSKGYIVESTHEDRLSLPQHVLDDLIVASAASKACQLTYTCGRRSFEEYLHIAGDRVIRLVRWAGEADGFTIERTNGGKPLSGALAGRMRWNSRTPGELPALMMSKKQFDMVMSQTREMDLHRLAALLAEMTGDVEGSIALAKCMKTPLAQGEIRFYANRGDGWEIQQMQFMNNTHMNWLIRFSAKDDEDWMIVTPTPRQQFQEILLKWFQQPVEAE